MAAIDDMLGIEVDWIASEVCLSVDRELNEGSRSSPKWETRLLSGDDVADTSPDVPAKAMLSHSTVHASQTRH